MVGLRKYIVVLILIVGSLVLSYITWKRTQPFIDSVVGDLNTIEANRPHMNSLIEKLNEVNSQKLTQDLPLKDQRQSDIPLDQDPVNFVHEDISQGIQTLGSITNTSITQFAVFSCSTSNREAKSFAYYLPMTVKAWSRIGYGSIIMISGTKEDWYAEPVLNYALETLATMDAFIIFLSVRRDRSIMVSQVSRLFAANILHTINSTLPDFYLVTSDADLWPLKDAYKLAEGKSILSLNSDCCGRFHHKGRSYKMIPMANIGMHMSHWRNITTRNSITPVNADSITSFMVREFGRTATHEVTKGENAGWYLDQHTISIIVSEYAQIHPDSVHYIPREISRDRIDRSNWRMSKMERKVDAHLLSEPLIPGEYIKLRPLLQLMYKPEEVDELDEYHHKFIDLNFGGS